MQNNLPSSDIFKNLRTLKETEEFLSQINNTLESLFKIKRGSFSQVLDKNMGAENAQILKKIAEEKKIDLSNHSSLEKLLFEIKQEISKVKVLKLYLAIDPTPQIIENLGEDVVLDIERDETILGGAIISFDGQYKDFSLRKTLDEIFKSKRNE